MSRYSRMGKIFFTLLLLGFTGIAKAELVTGEGAVFQRSAVRNIVAPGGDLAYIRADIEKIESSLGKSQKSNNTYVYINKCIPGASCMTYVYNRMTRSVEEKFATLNGTGRMGCGKTNTEPGLFQLDTKTNPPKTPKPHWGEQTLVLMNPIDPLITRCPHDTDKVVHARKDVEVGDSAATSGNTFGCMGMPVDKYLQLTNKLRQGVVVYNTEDGSPGPG